MSPPNLDVLAFSMQAFFILYHIVKARFLSIVSFLPQPWSKINANKRHCKTKKECVQDAATRWFLLAIKNDFGHISVLGKFLNQNIQ